MNRIDGGVKRKLSEALFSGDAEKRGRRLEEILHAFPLPLEDNGLLSFSDVFCAMTDIAVEEACKNLPGNYADESKYLEFRMGVTHLAPESPVATKAVDATAEWLRRFAENDYERFSAERTFFDETAAGISKREIRRYAESIQRAFLSSSKSVGKTSPVFYPPPLPAGLRWGERASLYLLSRTEYAVNFEGKEEEEFFRNDVFDWRGYLPENILLNKENEETLKSFHSPYLEVFFSPRVVKLFASEEGLQTVDGKFHFGPESLSDYVNKMFHHSSGYFFIERPLVSEVFRTFSPFRPLEERLSNGEDFFATFEFLVDLWERREKNETSHLEFTRMEASFLTMVLSRFSRLVEKMRDSGYASEFFSLDRGKRLLRIAAEMREQVPRALECSPSSAPSSKNDGKRSFHVPGTLGKKDLCKKGVLDNFFKSAIFFGFDEHTETMFEPEKKILHAERLFIAENIASLAAEGGTVYEKNENGDVEISPRAVFFLDKIWKWGPIVSKKDTDIYRKAAIKSLVDMAEKEKLRVNIAALVRACVEKTSLKNSDIIEACRDILLTIEPETVEKIRKLFEEAGREKSFAESRVKTIAAAQLVFDSCKYDIYADEDLGDDSKGLCSKMLNVEKDETKYASGLFLAGNRDEAMAIFNKYTDEKKAELKARRTRFPDDLEKELESFYQRASARYSNACPDEPFGFLEFLVSVDASLSGRDSFAKARRELLQRRNSYDMPEDTYAEGLSWSDDDFLSEMARSAAFAPLFFEELEDIVEEFEGKGAGEHSGRT